MSENEKLETLRDWLLNHSKSCIKEQMHAENREFERFYHGLNCAYINAANACDALLRNETLAT